MDEKTKTWVMIWGGIALFIFDLYTYHFDFTYSNVTPLGWAVYAAAGALIIWGGARLLGGK
jgi:hypothetical protein